MLITGSPYYPMMFAPVIKRRFGVPVVLDFQDPWVSTWGASQPAFSKAGLMHRLAVALEPHALRGADFVTSVSENSECRNGCAIFLARCGENGSYSNRRGPRRFYALSVTCFPCKNCSTTSRTAFTSAMWARFCLAPGPLFALSSAPSSACARQSPRSPRVSDSISLGTSNQPNDVLTCRVRPIAEAEGVADVVREIPQRLPYSRALGWIARSRGVLLIGSDEPHYTASKIYPALMSGRPFVSLFHRASSAHAILAAAGGGRAFAFNSSDELASIEVPLAEALRCLACTPELFGTADPAAYAPYQASVVARRFGSIFDRLAAERSG